MQYICSSVVSHCNSGDITTNYSILINLICLKMEGDDDMPGHVKSSLMGPSLNIPIRDGRLGLGTWQGIYLNERRDQGGWGGGHTRRIIITIQGQG